MPMTWQMAAQAVGAAVAAAAAQVLQDQAAAAAAAAQVLQDQAAAAAAAAQVLQDQAAAQAKECEKQIRALEQQACAPLDPSTPFAFQCRNPRGGRWRLNGVLRHGDALLQVEDMQTALDERANQVSTLQQQLDASEQEVNHLKRKNDELYTRDEVIHEIKDRFKQHFSEGGGQPEQNKSS
jgi:hypothetical protein